MRVKILVVIPFLAAILFFFQSYTGFAIQKGVLVERVIDGDTIVIEGGERVRLLGIDTPEKGQHFFEDSTDFVKDLIEGKRIQLEKDTSEKDKYERLLRYVYVGDVFVNIELIKNSYATALIYPPDNKHEELFLQEEAKARQQGGGIWSFPQGDYCLSIFYFHYNAKGNDNKNLNDEYIIFRNKCFHPLSLKGWTLQDKINTTFLFPDIAIENKTFLTLHTGEGENNNTDLFWGKTRAVWNNKGDTLMMLNTERQLMLNHSY